ncbi:MAG: hypothetical protein ACREM2_11505 [Vulcanimicrobiaceae bacterium]
MSDHFRTIGFALERPELDALLRRALGGGRTISAPHGDYHVFAPGGGAELWVNVIRDGAGARLAGLAPHFAATTRLEAVVEALEPHAEFPLEGELYAWASCDGREHGRYPFSASVPDFDASLAARPMPLRATLALAAFAADLEVWRTEAAYRAARDSETAAFEDAPLVPIGLFGEARGRARSRSLVSGAVECCNLRANPATERLFRVVRIATYGGEIEIVAPPELLPDDLAAGTYVRASAWLTARIVACEPIG